MSLNIIFEDPEILVLDKPAGLIVNKSQTTNTQTLQDQLAVYFNLGDSLGIGERAGIVHRLDRETSGLMIVAKTQKSFEKLQEDFKNRRVQKEYEALVHGTVLESDFVIDKPIGRVGAFGKFGIVVGGRESQTIIHVDSKFKASKVEVDGDFTKSRIRYLKNHAQDYSLLTAYPKTGRTHQIRVHTKSMGHPIVSDSLYAPAKLLQFDLSWCPRLFLHARAITFKHPASGAPMFFESELPQDLKQALAYLTINK
ncbi:RluA family pseudouridine synthase [Candidatus Curtissbacteria bacterium]|nr:RluA family pseudouridine synthase [Candidatus Curtissbacteria bacterium]